MDDARRRWLPDDEASVASRATTARLLRAWAPFRFVGRLGRGVYVLSLVAWHVACAIAAGLVFTVVLVSANLIGGEETMNAAFFATTAVLGAVYVFGLVGYAVRRLHDLGRGGAWVVLGFVPLGGFVFFAVLLVAPGEAGENAYGAAPPRPVVASVDAADVAGKAGHPDVFGGATAPAEQLEAAFDAGRRFAERRDGRA